MKYCAKCGNQMEDDMMFCQKCGTKFEGVVEESNRLEVKLEQIKKYNLVIDANSISWQYIHEDGERAGQIVAKQNNMVQELRKLVTEVLDNVTDNERDIVEREIYTYILKMGSKMCQEGAKLFENRSGYKELFEQGNQLVISGQLGATQFLDGMLQVDQIYKVTAGLQGLNAWELKQELDENVIYDNLEFRKLTIGLAKSFNEMWNKCIKRYTDFFLSPGVDFINTNWNEYEDILKGLTQSEIDILDESGWDFALDDWEKNHDGRQYKEDFNRKRNQKREDRRKKEKEASDKKYWESHPNEFALSKEKESQKKELETFLSCKNREIEELEKEKNPSMSKKTNLEQEVKGKEQRIEKLGKKIFGKKKAEGEIQTIQSDIVSLNSELSQIEDKIKQMDKPIVIKRNEKNELQRNIRNLEQEISDLRNKD